MKKIILGAILLIAVVGIGQTTMPYDDAIAVFQRSEAARLKASTMPTVTQGAYDQLKEENRILRAEVSELRNELAALKASQANVAANPNQSAVDTPKPLTDYESKYQPWKKLKVGMTMAEVTKALGDRKPFLIGEDSTGSHYKFIITYDSIDSSASQPATVFVDFESDKMSAFAVR